MGRAPHGARGLKQKLVEMLKLSGGRAPHGARGLKLMPGTEDQHYTVSRPARGAWIETRDD